MTLLILTFAIADFAFWFGANWFFWSWLNCCWLCWSWLCWSCFWLITFCWLSGRFCCTDTCWFCKGVGSWQDSLFWNLFCCRWLCCWKRLKSLLSRRSVIVVTGCFLIFVFFLPSFVFSPSLSFHTGLKSSYFCETQSQIRNLLGHNNFLSLLACRIFLECSVSGWVVTPPILSILFLCFSMNKKALCKVELVKWKFFTNLSANSISPSLPQTSKASLFAFSSIKQVPNLDYVFQSLCWCISIGLFVALLSNFWFLYAVTIKVMLS